MRNSRLLVLVLTVGVFGIINTEMGVIGILPYLADRFGVSVAEAGLLVSLFALAIAVSGLVLPPALSGVDRKKLMVLVLGAFTLSSAVQLATTDFYVMLAARVLPAFLHPVYCSMAFAVAAATAPPGKSSQAVARVFVGVSAGMVLGVPVSNFLAETFSLEMALAFFALVNGAALLATVILVPSLPVEHRLSYGAQIGVLKKPVVLVSILAVVLMNGAVFGVFSYLAAYLGQMGMTPALISMALLAYGLANIAGNVWGGHLMAWKPMEVAGAFPMALALVYAALFMAGPWEYLTVGLVVFWGVLGGINAVLNQYWLTRSAPEAPDFANALFLVAANLGTVGGSLFCGQLLLQDSSGLLLGGLLLSLGSGVVLWSQLWGRQHDPKTAVELED